MDGDDPGSTIIARGSDGGEDVIAGLQRVGVGVVAGLLAAGAVVMAGSVVQLTVLGIDRGGVSLGSAAVGAIALGMSMLHLTAGAHPHEALRRATVAGVALAASALAIGSVAPLLGRIGPGRWGMIAAALALAAGARQAGTALATRLGAWVGSDDGTPGFGGVRRRASLALPWLLVVAVSVNVFHLVRYVPPVGQPLQIHSGGELSDLVRASGPSVRERYGLYVDLGDRLDGGVLVVPDGRLLDGRLVRGLGGMDMEVRDFDAAIDRPLADPDGRVRTGDGPVAYWMLPGGGRVFWLARIDDGVVIVPAEVIPVPGGSE